MTILLILASLIIVFYIVKLSIKGVEISTNSKGIKSEKRINTAILLTPKQFVEKYRNKQGQVEGGTLCFWGHWFGRPYDNIHQIAAISYDTNTNILTINFSEEEILTVTNPFGIEEYSNRLQINQADKIYWQWYSYGEAKEKENLCYYNIIKNESIITGSIRGDRYISTWNDLTSTKPAVLIFSSSILVQSPVH